MSVLVQFSVVPLGQGSSVSPAVAKALRIVAESGLTYKATPMGTVLEGEWDAVMAVVKQCHQEVLKSSDRVLTSVSIDDRKGMDGRIDKKLASVEHKLGRELKK